MSGYLINFIVYTTSMIGLIFLALFTFKKCTNICIKKKTTMLNVEDTMKLSPRKTLYIIKAENERFLVAADMERTSLIARLNDNDEIPNVQELKNIKNTKNVQAIKNIQAAKKIDKPINTKIPQSLTNQRSNKSTKLSSFDGIDTIDEFSSVLKFQKAKKAPVMKELARKVSAL